MGNISWTRYNVVIMFQIPQKIDVQESTLAIMTEFDEAKNAQIQIFLPSRIQTFP